MFKVKLSAGKNDQAFPFIIQTPSNSLKWKNYEFYTDGEDRKYDFWIVLEELADSFEKTICKEGGVIFIAGEPISIRDYKSGFLEQFDYIIGLPPTPIEKIKFINTHKYLPWHISKKYFSDTDNQIDVNYDLLQHHIPVKDKLLSVICSPKTISQGHRDRIKFVEALKEYFGDRIDVYGLDGFTSSIGLSHYKYHIAIENSSYEHYWSEKLADAYLSECYPFYFGAKNIKEYFNENSLSEINIYDINASIDIIEKAISDDYFSKYYSNIKSSKDKILNEYNLFNLIENLNIESVARSNYKDTLLLHERFFSSKLRALKKFWRIKFNLFVQNILHVRS